MANEITVDATLQADNGTFEFKRRERSFKADQTTVGGGGPGTTAVTTSEVTVDMTGYGFVWIQNLDATNYVQVGYSTGVYGQRLRAGGPPAMLELDPGTTLYLKANTATCRVDIFGLNL